MSAPRVSVILPTYNRAATLARSIRSVLAQTMDDLELIVIDDGSSDNTAQILASIDDPRLKVFSHQQRGAAASRNFAAQQARADWLAFQDSDDEWLVDKLERQFAVLNDISEPTALICGGYITLSPHRVPKYFAGQPEDASGQWTTSRIYDFGFITPTWLIARNAFEALQGFDEDMPNLEDWEFAFRWVQQFPIHAVDGPIVLKHTESDSLDSVPTRRIQSMNHMLSKHQALWHDHPNLAARMYDKLGRHYCRLGQMREGRAALSTALRYKPTSPSTIVQWGMSMMPNGIYTSARRGYRKMLRLR